MPEITCEGELDQTFSEEGQLPEGEPYIDKPATIFRAGFWKGKNYTTADLDRAVEQFREPKTPTDWDIPVQVDHEPASSTRTCGWVRSLHRDGNLLRATLRFSGAEAVSAVRGARYKKCSSGFRANGAVHHVAVTPYPYVLGSQFNEEVNPMATTPTIPVPPPDTPDPVKTFADMEARLEAQFAERTTKMQEQFNGQLAGMQSKMDAQEKVLRFAEMAAAVDTFSESAKIAPVARAAELDLVKTFSDEQLDLWKKAKEAAPSYVDFGVHNTAMFTEPGGQNDDSEALINKYPQPKGV